MVFRGTWKWLYNMQCGHLQHHAIGPYSSSDWLFFNQAAIWRLHNGHNEYCLALLLLANECICRCTCIHSYRNRNSNVYMLLPFSMFRVTALWIKLCDPVVQGLLYTHSIPCMKSPASVVWLCLLSNPVSVTLINLQHSPAQLTGIKSFATSIQAPAPQRLYSRKRRWLFSVPTPRVWDGAQK